MSHHGLLVQDRLEGVQEAFGDTVLMPLVSQ